MQAAPDKNPNEEDKAMSSQVQIDNQQKNNTTGTNIEQGIKQDQEQEENQKNQEERDYNVEENDYLFQVMQQ